MNITNYWNSNSNTNNNLLIILVSNYMNMESSLILVYIISLNLIVI